MLEILFQDEHLIAINKPHGLLVHKSPIAADAEDFAVQRLRNQTGQFVYPAHRLDRKTAGALLFALHPACNSLMQQQFANGAVDKTYLALVRGFTPDEGVIDYPLKREDGVEQAALTRFNTLRKIEIPIPFGKHSSSRYSLVELRPETGRFHQLRRHMAHIFHPIIGDRPHGCNKQNKLWKEQLNMTTMLLHASRLSFQHPITGQEISVAAPLQAEFSDVMRMLESLGNQSNS